MTAFFWTRKQLEPADGLIICKAKWLLINRRTRESRFRQHDLAILNAAHTNDHTADVARKEEVASLLGRLTFKERRLLDILRDHDCDNRLTAQYLRISVRAFRKRLDRIRDKLRD